VFDHSRGLGGTKATATVVPSSASASADADADTEALGTLVRRTTARIDIASSGKDAAVAYASKNISFLVNMVSGSVSGLQRIEENRKLRGRERSDCLEGEVTQRLSPQFIIRMRLRLL